jgi:hypothetical protein
LYHFSKLRLSKPIRSNRDNVAMTHKVQTPRFVDIFAIGRHDLNRTQKPTTIRICNKITKFPLCDSLLQPDNCSFKNIALLFMKSTFVLLICHFAFSLASLCQDVVEGRWTVEGGASTNNLFNESSSINLRYISPKFQLSNEDHYWTVEEEKHPEKFKKARFMFELLYAPPFNVLGTGLNLQYRILKLKRLSLEVYGGLKFFFVTRPDFGTRNSQRTWYINDGLICQLNLGMIAPFTDIGYDRIFTIGTEVNFHSIYKKAKRRYNLNLKTV